MSSGLTSNLDTNYPDSIGAELLSIALIGPDAERRRAVAGALTKCRGAEVREFSAYPPALDDVPRLLEDAFDVIIIDLDSNPEYALELVESICVKDTATVMVYSAMANQELVVRCMRAGAREYLDPPFDQSTVAEALVRASALLRQRVHPVKKARGRLLVFLGAKGGSGVTTIACSFALAMAQESPQSTPQSTLLIDLGLPLGDAALNLGIATEYSTDDAFRDPARLDSSLLHALLAKHDSGVSVLAGPSKVSEVPASIASVEKLVAVAREEFDYVIVDLGSRLDLMDTSLFRDAYRIYLVTQAGISELRNSNRLISRFFGEGDPRLEIVVNRFEPGYLGVTEENITRALGLPVRWKIPDDYDATRRMPNTDSPLSIADSPFSRLILEMTSSVTGHPLTHGKNHGLSLRGLGRDLTERISAADKPPSSLSAAQAIVSATPGNGGAPPTVTWPSPAPIPYGVPLSSAQSECHRIGEWHIRLHSRRRLRLAGGNAHALGHLHSGRRPHGAVRRFHHSFKSHANHQMADACRDPLRRTARQPAAQCHGIGSGNICLHSCRRRGARRGNAHALGHLHPRQRRQLHYCTRHRLSHCRKGDAGHQMAAAQTDQLRRAAQRKPSQCHGIGSGNICLHSCGR